MIYKVVTGVKVHWFKTLNDATRFASQYATWKVETPKNMEEEEWGKKCLRIPLLETTKT